MTDAEHEAIVAGLRAQIKERDKIIEIKADTNRKIFALNENLIAERTTLLDTLERWSEARRLAAGDDDSESDAELCSLLGPRPVPE